MSSQTSQTFSLRHTLRLKRRHLSKIQQHRHSLRISKRIIHSKLYKHSRHIALYLSADGEVNLSPLINKLHAHYKKCYLPVILSRRHAVMKFAPYEKNTRLKKNSFGILEPVYQKKRLRSSKQLDMILAPLVGFDEQGNRVGMGGGYYDRALQHLKRKNSQKIRRRPVFVGVAHEVQQTPEIESQSWDISLHAIVTERRLKFFN